MPERCKSLPAFCLAAAMVCLIPAGIEARQGPGRASPDPLQAALERQIREPVSRLFDHPDERVPRGRIQRRLLEFYRERGMQPVWTTQDGPNGLAATLRQALVTADTQGLEPADYSVGQIGRYWEARDAPRLARLELLLTLSLADYVADLVEGRRAPRLIDPKLFPTARDTEFDPAALIRTCLACGDLGFFLDDQAPPFTQYRELRLKLAEFRSLAAKGGWPGVLAGPSIKPGGRDARLSAVRKRLKVTGEWTGDPPPDEEVYDDALATAVERFQRHHGLDPDRIIGRATVAAMNVTAAERARQIVLNMESWRWVSRDHGDWQIMVNIPSFSLTGLRNDKADLTMSVIVGDAFHMTPVFSDRMRYVEFNPYWDIPASIARDEMLPKLRKDPNALKKDRIRIFAGPAAGENEVDPATVDWQTVSPDAMVRYHLRQDPGPDCALGLLGFLFPNDFAVYLHDTPALSLFQYPQRTFSHGCVRVARAVDLAVYLLRGQGKDWDEQRVRDLIAAGKNKVVRLDTPVPIYILYNTAEVDPADHEIFFYRDVYGRDRLLEKALFPNAKRR
jgi:murein L,D-transpeptidase YcbB/YkuD